jgi:hypothetical protein
MWREPGSLELFVSKTPKSGRQSPASRNSRRPRSLPMRSRRHCERTLGPRAWNDHPTPNRTAAITEDARFCRTCSPVLAGRFEAVNDVGCARLRLEIRMDCCIRRSVVRVRPALPRAWPPTKLIGRCDFIGCRLRPRGAPRLPPAAWGAARNCGSPAMSRRDMGIAAKPFMPERRRRDLHAASAARRGLAKCSLRTVSEGSTSRSRTS